MEIKLFIDQYAEELLDCTAALFVGAGISVPSNLPSWQELMAPFASGIGIPDIKGKDLPLIAQYIINQNAGNRGPFINAVSKKIRKKYSPNNYHKLIAKTNVKTIWTTNYDNLIETAFSNHIIDVKTNDDSISRDVPDSQVEIIKMHGCIFNSDRNDIVITESDYEDFFINKPATVHRLKLDLLQKSFLFIGYGYGDPNIKNIITEARRLSKNSTRQHYLITVKKHTKEFELWSSNLRKYGILVIEIEHFDELENILEQLSLKSRGRSVFVTGSHDNAKNKEAQQLGNALAEETGIILIDGQSTGVMRCATSAFLEKCVTEKKDIN
ncbi:MAG TPA: SIR2 family protein, partial [Bacteroidia bacterium]|nr:SIR2 family protein [Bacteroidia bacterium]